MYWYWHLFLPYLLHYTSRSICFSIHLKLTANWLALRLVIILICLLRFLLRSRAISRTPEKIIWIRKPTKLRVYFKLKQLLSCCSWRLVYRQLLLLLRSMMTLNQLLDFRYCFLLRISCSKCGFSTIRWDLSLFFLVFINFWLQLHQILIKSLFIWNKNFDDIFIYLFSQLTAVHSAAMHNCSEHSVIIQPRNIWQGNYLLFFIVLILSIFGWYSI